MPLETKGLGENYEFGPFRLSVGERVLWRNGQIVALTPKCFDTLLVLVRHGGSVVEKEALIREVWPDSFVEEGNLAQNIFTLRKTLGELSEGGQYIQTLPKRGYRLVAPVVVPPPAPQPVTTAPNRSPRRMSYIVAAGILVASSLIAARWVWPGGEPTVSTPRFTALAVPNNIVYGIISPDGKHIAYVSHDADGQSLWQRETAAVGAGIRLVPPVQGHFWGVGYPPDGQYLYYALEDERDPVEAALFRIPAQGGEPRKLFTGIATAPAFSPDGSRIVYKRYDPNGHGYLLTATPSGGEVRTLAESNAPYSFYNYRWAADGKNIYYLQGARDRKGTSWALWKIPASGGPARLEMAPQPRPLRSVNWLSGSEILALVPDEDSQAGQIWHVSTRGAFRRVSNDINNYSLISMTADGRTLLANSQVTDDSIWSSPAPGAAAGEAARMELPAGSYNDPAWTPDGRVVFAAQSNLWVATSDGRERKPLLANKVMALEPAVSPDGRFVVFMVKASGTRRLWRVDLDRGNLRQVTSGPYDWHPAISPNGRWVVYESNISGQHTLSKASLDSPAAPVKLADTGASDLTISSDSRRLAYRNDLGEVEVRSLEDGSLVRAIPAPADPSDLQWSADGRSIIYLCHTGDSAQFWSQALSGGPPVRLEASLPSDVRYLRWSADRRRIVYLRRQIRVDLALITNLQ
ncbi:MAG TPA: winged helix-turn-helix domain-containing protein [Bryobacteraceae bacterium]|nr:winged helix-turn-helix domain-containing protein [Bryobacteraceae bacterium]